MNYSSQTPDAISTVKILLNATAIYAIKRIQNKKDKNAYLKAVRYANHVINQHESLTDSLIQLKDERANLPGKFMQRFEVISDVKHYYLLAIDHSIDAIESINTRFVIGGRDPDLIMIHNILENKDEDTSIFGEI